MKQPLTLAFLYSRIKGLVREVVLLRRENAKLWEIVEELTPIDIFLNEDPDGNTRCDWCCGDHVLVYSGEAAYVPQPGYVLLYTAVPLPCSWPREGQTWHTETWHAADCIVVRAIRLKRSRSRKKAAAYPSL